MKTYQNASQRMIRRLERVGRALLVLALVGIPAVGALAQQRLVDEQVRRGHKEVIREERARELRQERREQFRERLRDADQNNDRALSRREAEQQFPRLGNRFDEIDSNGDGLVTRDELRNFREARRRARTWEGSGRDPRD